jgi:hypothetical protein
MWESPGGFQTHEFRMETGRVADLHFVAAGLDVGEKPSPGK